MTFDEYQKQAVAFRTATANNEEYLTLGLIEEVGEAAGKLAKRRRDGVFDEKGFIKELGDILWFVANLADYYDRINDTSFTLGLKYCFERRAADINFPEWSIMRIACYVGNTVVERDINFRGIVSEVARLSLYFDYTLEQVAEINLAKLRDRAARGKIHGNGDNR